MGAQTIAGLEAVLIFWGSVKVGVRGNLQSDSVPLVSLGSLNCNKPERRLSVSCHSARWGVLKARPRLWQPA